MLTDLQNRVVDQKLGLRVNRGLRRTLSSLNSGTGDALIQSIAQDYDPAKLAGAFQQRLRDAAPGAALAAQLNDRDAIQQQLDAGQLDPQRRDLLRQRLDQLPKWGSAAARFDPRDPGSTERRFGSSTLYRSF